MIKSGKRKPRNMFPYERVKRKKFIIDAIYIFFVIAGIIYFTVKK